MNWELLGLILIWGGLLWSIFVTGITYYMFLQLSPIQQKFAEINLNKEIVLFFITIIILGVYYVS